MHFPNYLSAIEILNENNEATQKTFPAKILKKRIAKNCKEQIPNTPNSNLFRLNYHIVLNIFYT